MVEMPAPDLAIWLQRAERVLEQALAAHLPANGDLSAAMRYAVLGPGKRLRPLLVYATGSTFGADPARLDAPAAAVELVHAYSLVHDDLPAMDDDALRRGRPTCHVEFGEATAILAGDALQALAFEVLVDPGSAPGGARGRVEMFHTLARACGAQGMAGGQALDLAAVGRTLTVAELERMHAHKTGALIRASVRLGALVAGAAATPSLDALDRYAAAVGLAFQVRDDLLDVESATEQLGKTAGKDAVARKPTYPSILGIDASYRRLGELVADAIEAIASLGGHADALVSLARYAAARGN